MTESPIEAMDGELAAVVRRHLRYGWWALLIFATLGIVLESLHGFKVGWYLNVSSTTRRHMFTLAHAHGVLLSLVNVVFAISLRSLARGDARSWGIASSCLIGASILMPCGFLLGGLWVYGGDPGLGIFLVPPGALLLWIAVFQTARVTTGVLAQGPGDR